MARRFTFRLQPVLEQRRRLEQERQREVGALERERIELEERIRAWQGAIGAARSDLRARLGGGGRSISLQDVRMQANASLHLAARAQQAVLELAGVHARLEAARRRLLEATTARKAVSLLRERRLAEWRLGERRREEREIDDLNTMRRGGRYGRAEEAV
jgi:flagellar FliJ protein